MVSKPKSVMGAVTAEGAADAQVVWLDGGKTDDVIARILLDFYRVNRTRERTPQGDLDVAQECDLLRRSASPAVLSDESLQAIAERYSCVTHVAVVAVSGRGHGSAGR